MIVCLCHAVSEHELEKLVENGAETPAQIEQKCGAGGDCGACHQDIERIIERVTLRPPASGLDLPVIQPSRVAG
jgi:bacterioferritin-associated ferredoxin